MDSFIQKFPFPTKSNFKSKISANSSLKFHLNDNEMDFLKTKKVRKMGKKYIKYFSIS